MGSLLPQLFVWEIPQILSKWPASPSCSSGCVSVERISLETVLQGSWISPSCKTDFLLHLRESLSLERCLIIPKLLAGKMSLQLGRQAGFLGLPSQVGRRSSPFSGTFWPSGTASSSFFFPLSPFNLITTLQSRSYYPHFTDKETEAQRDDVIVPRPLG